MRVHDSIGIDGSIFISDGDRVVWSVTLPDEMITAYCEAEQQPKPLHILWGESPECGEKPVTYQFTTVAEREAFLRGITEADGYLGWQEVDSPDVFVCEECDEVHGPGACESGEEE